MRKLFLVFCLLGFVVAIDAAAPVDAAPTTTSALFKVTLIRSEGGPAPGCTNANCPSVERQIPAFSRQADMPELGTASKIVASSFTPESGLSSNGGCGIIDGGLKCWGGNRFGQLGNETTTDSLTSLVVATDEGVPLTGIADVVVSSDATCVMTTAGAVRCVGLNLGTETTSFRGSPATFSKKWVTILSGSAKKVSLLSTDICVVKTDGTYVCSSLSASPNWVDSGLTGIKDVSYMCAAGTVSYCRAGGPMGAWTKVENADNSEAVYYVGANAICFYRLGALWCAPQTGGPGALKARLIGLMPQPLAVFNAALDPTFVIPTQMFIILKTGILTATASMISCENCYTSSNGVLSKISAVDVSTSTQYNNVVSINGTPSSLDFIPMTVTSDSRSLRSAIPISVKTASGEALKSASIRWNAPDAPGTVSSGSNPITTDEQGAARATVVSGPVSFTIQGGTTSSGATLQSAVVTTMVPTSGEILVTVPDAPAVVDRKVRVVMTDGSPVPSAQITLRNSYLAYAYQFSGTDVATWGAQKKDPKGYFAQPWCTWCFVPPPAYITGADGTITFKTFNTGATSSSYDVDVLYDDGALAQKVKHTFGTTSDTVTLPVMARITAALTDSDPSTPGIDVPVGTSGSVDVNVAAVDSSNGATSGLTAAVEEVCSGMDTGGLWQSELSIDNMCRDVSVSSVRAFGVGRSATCASTTSGATGADGKLKFTLCPTTSTKYRVRGKGSVATLAFCVVVGGRACGADPQSATNSPATTAQVGRTLRTGQSVLLKSLLRPAAGAKSSYRTTGACRVRGARFVAATKATTCRLILSQTVKGKRSTKTLVIRVA